MDQAVADRRITADMREQFVNIGKANGLETLALTLQLMTPKTKPTDVISRQTGTPGAPQGVKTYAKLSEVPADEVPGLKESDPEEYARLYRAEYGVTL